MNDGTQQKCVRLILLDEPGLFRSSLARWLAAEPGLEVMGECANSAEALELLKSSGADLVLLDFEIGGEPGSAFMSAARESGYQGRYLIVACAPDVRKSALALKLGASGIFLKSDAPERLVCAIKAVAEGGVWVDPKVIHLFAEQLIDRRAQASQKGPWNRLDLREQDVLLGIVGGMSNRSIGEDMGLSESAIKNIVQRLFGKAGVKTRSQLVRVALEGSLGPAQDFLRCEPREVLVGSRAKSHDSDHPKASKQPIT